VKKYLFSILFCSVLVFGQPQNFPPSIAPVIPFETGVISLLQTDSIYSVYYTYKIPYRLLVFERENDLFKAGFRIAVEIVDNDGNLIARDIKDNNLSVNNFEETSNTNLILQDYLSFKVKPADYKVNAIISDRNSSGERPLKPVDLNLEKSNQTKFLQPIVIRAEKIDCDNKPSFVLANSAGKIPFSADNFNLVIPIIDTSITQLDFSLKNNGEEISSGTLNNSIVEGFDLIKCKENLLLTESFDIIPTRNFIINYVNQKLDEGELLLTIKNEDNQLDEEIGLNVVWFHKPISLFNSEKAIEILSYIESESIVDSLLSMDESEYPKIIKDYWAKYDPTPETSYNEILYEFYNRVDYAMREFSSITNNNGAKSDRGMVYIKFGKPDKIDRTSNSLGEVLEMWTYSNTQRKFTFIDKIGTGNFTLIEN